MVSLVGDTLLNWMNRDRGNDQVLDQITKDGRCLLLGGCLDGATLYLTEWRERWLICRNLCMPSYIQNRQIMNRETPHCDCCDCPTMLLIIQDATPVQDSAARPHLLYLIPFHLMAYILLP